jgi:hypothetical protein
VGTTSSGPEIPPTFMYVLRPFFVLSGARGSGPNGLYPSRPGRRGFSLQRTGMMVMIHRLRGRLRHPTPTGVSRFFAKRPRGRPEKATHTYPPLRPFSCSQPRQYRCAPNVPTARRGEIKETLPPGDEAWRRRRSTPSPCVVLRSPPAPRK